MPRTLREPNNNPVLFRLLFISTVLIMVATVQLSSSLQSSIATTSSSSATPLFNDGDNIQQGGMQVDMLLVNKEELSLLSNTTIDIAAIPADVILNTGQCLGEWAIYVHGVWTDREEALEQAERINLAIPPDKKIPLFAFFWKGDTRLTPFGWDTAKDNTVTAGHKLAEIIAEPKSMCPTDEVRLIAHSLGGRVVLSALDSLENNNNTRWKEERHNITSVHLIGAAVDDEKISQDRYDIDYSPFDDGKVYGNAIERNVVNFTNLYNPEDDRLEKVDKSEQQTDNQLDVYPYYERDNALGSWGIQNASIDKIDIPANYEEKNVQNEILPIIDADAGYIDEAPFPACDVNNYVPPFNCTISGNRTGDNHKGYMGFRDPTNSSRLVSNGGDGAIDVIVSDWWIG